MKHNIAVCILSILSLLLHVYLFADVYYSRHNPLITTTSVVPQQSKEQLLFLYIEFVLILILGIVVVVIFCAILLKHHQNSSSVPGRCLSTTGAKHRGKRVLINTGVQLNTMLQFLCRRAHFCTKIIICFAVCKMHVVQLVQVAQLSQRDRAAGWVSYGQKWKTGIGRQYLWTL